MLSFRQSPIFRRGNYRTSSLFRRGVSSGARNGNQGLPPYLFWGGGSFLALSAFATYRLRSRCRDTVPLTDRARFIYTSPEWEHNMGDEQFKALLQNFKGKILPNTHRATVTVKRVGSRIAGAAIAFCEENNLKHMQSKPFTYTVVRSDQANAFVLPGNHIFVLTGLFKYVKNEDDLAAILGHEMAHNVARHVGERVSDSMMVGIWSAMLLLLDPSGALTALFGTTAELAFSRPHSRTSESEADRIGIELAARACYDPEAAKRVFAAMKDGDGLTPPEFLSTHPSHSTRISQFDAWMESANQTFRGSDMMNDRCARVREEMAAARQAANAEASHREQQPKARA